MKIKKTITRKKLLEKIKVFFGNKMNILLLIILLFELFLRFYQLDIRTSFGYDQVDYAWAAKDIIVKHVYPLVGTQAKANSGIYIGPLYYYFVSIFYFISGLNPIASGIIAGVSSIFTFFVLYFITKKLFSQEVAIIAITINTFNFNTIVAERVEWPVGFIAPFSFIIFYLLYKVILGDVKKIILLAIFIGLMFNIHFTAIFFPIIVFLSLPLWPMKKETLRYFLISLPFFIVFLIPNIIHTLISKAWVNNTTSYLADFYHGLHLRRMMQLYRDAIIQFDYYLIFGNIKFIKVFFIPLFFLLYLHKTPVSERIKFCYLIGLWFLVPWIVFTMYSGEISDYYFSISRHIAVMIMAYLIFRIWLIKLRVFKAIVIIFLFAYCTYNFMLFLPFKSENSLKIQREKVLEVIGKGEQVKFTPGAPESYFYYYYMLQKGEDVY